MDSSLADEIIGGMTVMPSAEIRNRYSCRRKRDFITGTAISMFALLVLFQFFLVLVLPVLLSRKNAWDFFVAKEEMLRQLDSLRHNIRGAPSKTGIQKGEVDTVRNVADLFAMSTRSAMDDLTWEQVAHLKRVFGRLDAVQKRWREKPARYYIIQEKVNMPALMSHIESEIQETPVP